MNIPDLKIEDSILARYVSDEKNDGTYTLNLTNAETLELWDKIDAQTRALMALVAAEEASCEQFTAKEIDAIEAALELAHAALTPSAAPSNISSEPTAPKS